MGSEVEISLVFARIIGALSVFVVDSDSDSVPFLDTDSR
jgi:hypothetical protein